MLQEMQVAEHAVPEDRAAELKVCITTGSQDALTKCFEMLMEEGESVLVESPTYSGALAALHPMNLNLVGVETDGDGLKPESMAALLDGWDESLQGPKPRVLYTIPTGSNPTGATLSDARRCAVYETVCRHDLLLLEDDPYWHLQFCRQEDRPSSFLKLDTEGRVLRFDSMSKILSSGLRFGWATGPAGLMERLELHGQSSHLHASGVSQAVVLALLERWNSEGDGWEKHLDTVRGV